MCRYLRSDLEYILLSTAQRLVSGVDRTIMLVIKSIGILDVGT